MDALETLHTELVGISDQMSTIMDEVKAGRLSSENALEWSRWTERATRRLEAVKEELTMLAFADGADDPAGYRRGLAGALEALDGMLEAVQGMTAILDAMRPSLRVLEEAGEPIPLPESLDVERRL